MACFRTQGKTWFGNVVHTALTSVYVYIPLSVHVCVCMFVSTRVYSLCVYICMWIICHTYPHYYMCAYVCMYPWVYIYHICVRAQSLSHVWLFATPWTVARQALLSMGFSRQEHWRGLPFPFQGIFSTYMYVYLYDIYSHTSICVHVYFIYSHTMHVLYTPLVGIYIRLTNTDFSCEMKLKDTFNLIKVKSWN